MNKLNRTLLLISYDFPPSTGGIARLCHEIITHMQDFYGNINVITIEKDGEGIPYQDVANLSITYLPKKRGKAELAALKILRNWPNKENTDVLCGIWHPEATLALLAGMHNIYILAHGTELLSGTSKFRKFFWHPIYAKWVLGRAEKVIANSKYTQNLVKQINAKAMSFSIPLGVNHEFFKPLRRLEDKTILKICTVSRVLQFKGHDFILESLENLPSEYHNKIQWHIAGTGPFLVELKDRASKSIIKDQIFFHGFVPDVELPQFYNNADLFVLATREQKNSTQIEGFGLVFLEAQSCGIPVIGANTGGIPDAIDSGNGGWLIEQDNQEEFHAMLVPLIKNRELLKNQGLKARKRVEEVANWKIYAQKLYKEMSV